MIVLLDTTVSFTPTHWARVAKVRRQHMVYRYQTSENMTCLNIDADIYIPNCEVLGLMPCVNTTKHLRHQSVTLSGASVFVYTPQTLKVYYRGRYYDAAISGITYELTSYPKDDQHLWVLRSTAFAQKLLTDLNKWLGQNT